MSSIVPFDLSCMQMEASSSPLAKVRNCLNMLAGEPYNVSLTYRKEASGTMYAKKFALSDANIILDYEDTTFLDSDTAKVLDKPRLLLSTMENNSDRRVATTLAMEWQWLVNVVDNGKLQLDGYCQLCEALLNREEFGWAWNHFGLIPRQCQVGTTMDGSRIAVELKSRVLLRSIYTTMSFTGDLINGSR